MRRDHVLRNAAPPNEIRRAIKRLYPRAKVFKHRQSVVVERVDRDESVALICGWQRGRTRLLTIAAAGRWDDDHNGVVYGVSYMLGEAERVADFVARIACDPVAAEIADCKAELYGGYRTDGQERHVCTVSYMLYAAVITDVTWKPLAHLFRYDLS